jgi:hypothetical protein
MAQLQVPLSIWLDATPDERDGFYLAAGFDPNLPVIDNGTDNSFVRFRQDSPVISPAIPVMVGPQPLSGDDLRDYQPVSVIPGQMNGYAPPDPVSGDPIAGVGLSIAGRALRLILGGGGGRLTASIWNSLPSLVRTGLTQAGIYAGAMIAFNGDIPFITLPGQGGAIDAAQEGVGGAMDRSVDVQIVSPSPLQQVQVVGSWVANGVTFYRLADGKLAVQNKKGRWKVWRPKKPIVLYADGASNLKTMLRADKALNKQAKKIAAMLNRRAPKRRTSKKDDQPTIIVQGSGRVIDN